MTLSLGVAIVLGSAPEGIPVGRFDDQSVGAVMIWQE